MKFNKNILISILIIILILGFFYVYMKNNKVKKTESFCNLKNNNAYQILETNTSIDSYLGQIDSNIAILESTKASYGCTKPEIVEFILSKHLEIDIVEINSSNSSVSFHRKDSGAWSDYIIQTK